MTVLRDALVDFACLAADQGGREDARAGERAPRGAVGDEARAVEAAFALIYGQNSARIHRFLRDLLGDAALAADATQETFVRAFRQREAFEPGRAIAPWLFGIARNVALEMRRARHRARRVIAVDNDEGDAPEARMPGSPESELLGREALRIVEAAVQQLSDDRRAMLLLRLDHGLSYDEIAELMGFSLAKVKVEIFRARETLRETMADYEKGGAK